MRRKEEYIAVSSATLRSTCERQQKLGLGFLPSAPLWWPDGEPRQTSNRWRTSSSPSIGFHRCYTARRSSSARQRFESGPETHTHTLWLPAFIFNWHRMCLSARICVFVYLCVRAALPLTLVAGEHVCLGPAHLGQLMLSDGLFGQSFSHLLQLGTGHLLHTHTHTMRK